MKEVPQIHPATGISQDYINEYVAKIDYFGEGFLAEAVEVFQNSPIRKYEEVYPESEYSEVINNKNKSRVRRLNELAEIANREFQDEATFNGDRFREVSKEVRELIYGATQ